MTHFYPPMERQQFSSWKTLFNRCPSHSSHAHILETWLHEGLTYQDFLDVPVLYPVMLEDWAKRQYPKGTWYTSFAIQNMADITYWPEEHIQQVILNASTLTYNFTRQIIESFPEYIPLLEKNMSKMERLELKEWFIGQLGLSPGEQISRWFQELPSTQSMLRSDQRTGLATQWGHKVRTFMQEHKEATLQAIKVSDVERLYELTERRKELSDILKTILHQRPELVFQVNWEDKDIALLLQLANVHTLAQWRLLDNKAPQKTLRLYGTSDSEVLLGLLTPWIKNMVDLWPHIKEIDCCHTQCAKNILTLLDKAAVYEGNARITCPVNLHGVTSEVLLKVIQGKGTRYDSENIQLIFGDRRLKNIKKVLNAHPNPKAYLDQFHHVADFYCAVAYEHNKKRRLQATTQSVPDDLSSLCEEINVLF